MSDYFLVLLFIVGMTLLALFSVILDALRKRRLRNEKPYDGDIFINKEGDMYAQFEIPVDAIIHKKSVHMRVHYVKPRKEKE